MSKWVVSMAVVLAAAGLSWGQSLHTNYDSLLKAADTSGKPLLIVYMQPTTCPICNGARDYMIGDATALKVLRPRFEVAEIQIATGDERYNGYRQKIVGMFLPFWVIATPEGDYIDGGDGKTIQTDSVNDWRKKVAGIVAKYPPVSKQVRDAAPAALAKAKEAIEAGQYGKAHQDVTNLLKTVWYPQAVVDQAKTLLSEIEAQGVKRLAEAGALADRKEPLDAALVYHRLVTDFTVALPAGKDAAAQLGKLYAVDKTLAPRVLAIRKAEKMLQSAQALEREGKTAQARLAYQAIVTQCKDAPAAAAAAEAIARLDNPPPTTQPDSATEPAPADTQGATPSEASSPTANAPPAPVAAGPPTTQPDGD